MPLASDLAALDQGNLTIRRRDPAAVPTPAEGEAIFFRDLTGAAMVKDSAGQVHTQLSYLGAQGMAAQDPANVAVAGGAVRASTGLGYAAGAGAGGTVTQAGSKSTSVTLDRLNGRITMHAASLAAGASVTFTLTNALVAPDDTIIVHRFGASGTAGAYVFDVDAAAGSASITVTNRSPNPLGEAIVLKFFILKGGSN